MNRPIKWKGLLSLCVVLLLISLPAQHSPVRASGMATFVHAATTANIDGSVTAIDNPTVNDDGGAFLIVTQNWNPDGIGGTYNPHPIGVRYYTFHDHLRWVIYNRDNQPMPPGASFNVGILPAQPENFQRADAGNVGPNFILFNHSLMNANPGAMVIITIHMFGPPSTHTPPFASPIGVWYSNADAKWSGFTEDMVGTPSGIGFNVITFAPSVGMVHRTAVGNVVANSTYVDLPYANGNPHARLFVTHNWNPDGVGGTYFRKEVGVWYDVKRQRWAIFTQDRSTMPVGIAFNVTATG